MAPINYLKSDAALLLATLYASGSSTATLRGVLSVAAGLPHAPMTYSEFDGGIARLAQGGYVAFNGKHVNPTASALVIAETSATQGESMDQLQDRLEKQLASDSPTGALFNDIDEGWTTEMIQIDEFDSGFAATTT
ncbi:MAG: hypothetical protein AAGA03_05530 [Planctomycetota bacterium]